MAAFPSIRDVKELHARQLKPLMASPDEAEALLAEADRIATEQAEARAQGAESVPAAKVMTRLKAGGQAAAHAQRGGPGVQPQRREGQGADAAAGQAGPAGVPARHPRIRPARRAGQVPGTARQDVSLANWQ